MSEEDRRPREDESGTEREDDFLGRWSRLKHASREQPADPEPAPTPASPAPAEAGTEVAPEEAEPPSDEDLPDPEDLDDDADFSAFMSPRVSEGLRRRALRRMFRNPAYNVRDGLDDYTFDYRNFIPLGDTRTADLAGRIAKGLVRRLEDGGWEDIEEAAAVAAANEPEAGEEAGGDAAPVNRESTQSGTDVPQEQDEDDERDA